MPVYGCMTARDAFLEAYEDLVAVNSLESDELTSLQRAGASRWKKWSLVQRTLHTKRCDELGSRFLAQKERLRQQLRWLAYDAIPMAGASWKLVEERHDYGFGPSRILTVLQDFGIESRILRSSNGRRSIETIEARLEREADAEILRLKKQLLLHS